MAEMIEILPKLFLSDLEGARNDALLAQHGISSVLRQVNCGRKWLNQAMLGMSQLYICYHKKLRGASCVHRGYFMRSARPAAALLENK